MATLSDSMDWLLTWFGKRGGTPKGNRELQRATNYFESGFIDSFAVIELIGDAESEFGIQFAEQHFQDRRFATIGGLAEIICELTDSNDSRRVT
jgi:acyl carrier protein